MKISKKVILSIATSVALLAGTTGIVFGVSAGAFRINYMNLSSDDKGLSIRLSSANSSNCNYDSQNSSSQWNMEHEQPSSADISLEEWTALHGDSPLPQYDKNGNLIKLYDETNPEQAAKNRWNYVSMVIDGSTHTSLDRSFNQSLYNGLVNFIQQQDIPSTSLIQESTIMPTTILNNFTAASYKPAEDSNNGLANTYKAVATSSDLRRVIGLAGFNHCSPLGILGKYNSTTQLFEFSNEFADLAKMNMLLIDGNISNNQNIASVLFRSDQGAFLTGITTCMYFLNNLKIYHSGYKTLSIGEFGGNPIPTVTVYMGGMQRGVEFFNKFVLGDSIIKKGLDAYIVNQKELTQCTQEFQNLYANSKYKNDIANVRASKDTSKISDLFNKLYDEYSVRIIKLGDFGTHFTGSFVPGDAIGITKQYLNRGASAIIAVAGPQSLDSAQEIQNQKSSCIVIGVDSAMEEGSYQRSADKSFADVSKASDNSEPAQKNNVIKFSAVKDMRMVTQKFSDLSAQGKNFDIGITDSTTGKIIPDPEKAICNVGYKTCGNIENSLISISFDGWHPLVQALNLIDWKYHKTETLTETVPFSTVWTDAAKSYINNNPSLNLPSEISDLTKIDTYNKNKILSSGWTVEKAYSYIMAILGSILSSELITFDFTNMSLIKKEVETGKYQYVKDENATALTILQWLKNNMYFSC